MVRLNALSQSTFSIFNAKVAPGGPVCFPVRLDFTTVHEYDFDASQLTQRGFVGFIQTLFIDASNSAVVTTVTVGLTGQVLVIQPATQGYYPVLAPNPCRLVFTAASGLVNVFVFNNPIAPFVWTV